MQGRLRSFRAYCELNGYDLLRDDYRFIDKVLDTCARNDFKGILQRYLSEWEKGMRSNENGVSSQGIGRRRANQWLLGYANDKGKKNALDDVRSMR